MEESALHLLELGAVFFGLGLLGRLAGRIGLSPIPLYPREPVTRRLRGTPRPARAVPA